jgi:hypothetical protein
MGEKPIGVAATRNTPGDVEDVLGGECQTCKRPIAGTGQSDLIMSTERADAVGLAYVHDFPSLIFGIFRVPFLGQ